MRPHEPWYRPVPLASSAASVVAIAVGLTVGSLLVLRAIEVPDLDVGGSASQAWRESTQVHGIFTVVWVFLHPVLMRRGLRVAGRATLACLVWGASAAAWYVAVALLGSDAAAEAGENPFTWRGWSLVLLVALSPAVLIGAMIGESAAGPVAAMVRSRVEDGRPSGTRAPTEDPPA